MKTVIIDICKYLLLALIALGLVAILAGCGDNGGGGIGTFPPDGISPDARLPSASEISAIVKTADSRFPVVTDFAYKSIPATTYFASPGSYELVAFVWNTSRASTLPVIEIFVDGEGFEYHIEDPGYGRKPTPLPAAYAEFREDRSRGIVPVFIVKIGTRLILTTDLDAARSFPSFVTFFAFHPSTPR